MAVELELTDAERDLVLAHRRVEADKRKEGEKALDTDDIRPGMTPQTSERARLAILAKIRESIDKRNAAIESL